MPTTGARRLLFISNGHGEDTIAAAIIKRLPPRSAEAYPTLGSGSAYGGVCPVVGPRANLPSEGWRNVKGSLRRDLSGGMLWTLWPGLKFLRAARQTYDRVIVVGDMIGVYGCFFTGIRNIVYLDVYKTGFGRGYLGLDTFVLQRSAGVVFCRAESLAASLRDAGIDARYAGNVMMDTVPRGDVRLAGRRSRPLGLTILPGSRAHAANNFALQVAALRLLPEAERPDLFLAVASSLDVADLASSAGLKLDGDTLADGALVINIVPGAALGNALDVSDMVLSQAGTATVQALGLGKPAITFQTGDDRPSRFTDEGLLFSDARQVVPADPAAIAEKLRGLLANDAERNRLGAIGRQRIGGAGAIDAILAAI